VRVPYRVVRVSRSDDAETGARTRTRWAIAFLIGLATVTAAGFGWRAAQIGSTAAYDDRQSISETVAVEQGSVERAVTVASQAREYVRYRADYAVATALDHDADRLEGAGAGQLAAVSRGEATALRQGATRRAAQAGVFGPFSIDTDLLQPTAKPRPFDYRAQARALAAETATSLDSPGSLDPNHWALAADHIRVRTRDLTRWAFLAVLAILLYTIAEVALPRRAAYAALGLGVVVYLGGLVGGLSTAFF
jgi:hypothetical protein